MSLKILGGKVQALALQAPDSITRPTSVMLRRKAFDSHQNLTGITFVDLCAGSGAMGIEAYSRGACRVYFIELARSAYKVLINNIKSTQDRLRANEESDLRPWSGSAQSWLKKNHKVWEQQKDVILFLDPPYEKSEVYSEVINILSESEFCGSLWIESDYQKGLSLESLELLCDNGPARKVFTHSTHFLALWDFG